MSIDVSGIVGVISGGAMQNYAGAGGIGDTTLPSVAVVASCCWPTPASTARLGRGR